MKTKALAVALPFFAAWSSVSVSETCYTVEGEVKTVNVSETTQVGLVRDGRGIELLLLDEYDNEAFRETGDIVGTITGGGMGITFLSHSASFGKGKRGYEPCSFFFFQKARSSSMTLRSCGRVFPGASLHRHSSPSA